MSSTTDSHEALYPVLTAMKTMRDGTREHKIAAHQFLESFQKSTEAWQLTIGILNSQAEAEVKLFAATTLRGKITYDLNQISTETLPSLRDQILGLLKTHTATVRPIRVQLCVCLAILAIQMISWQNVLPTIVSSLGNDENGHSCILDFLKVLPEEVTEGRKINLTEDELQKRTTELLTNNIAPVAQLLVNYAQSSVEAAQNPHLINVITSWLREIPISDVVNSPLLNLVFNALRNPAAFEAAADCLCAIFRETRDVDECLPTIQILLPKLIGLRPQIKEAEEQEDCEVFKGLTRIFTEAGEAWVVLIAREPSVFRPIVEAILECCGRDHERDAIAFTFVFWYELKLYLILERYIEARMHYLDIYSQLFDIMLKQLEYPSTDVNDQNDLFDGDRDAEEKFREFRHQMGDVLKDCCEVMGVTECLTKVLGKLKVWMSTYGGQITKLSIPCWQQLEAPLFSMRAMGRMVDKEENIVLPQIMPILVQLPLHDKLRFATIMVLGRYTEWTSNHPELLESQFSYIVSSFQTDSKEIIRAAAMSLKFFCSDCKYLLSDQVLQLQQFYDQTLPKLPSVSQEELTEGVASVVAVQPAEQILALLQLYCGPLMTKLMSLANQATDEIGKLAIADHLQLITLFIQNVKPHVALGQENPAVKYCQEIFPILSTILKTFINFTPICERICRNWRYMVISYRTAIAPLLPLMANELANGFSISKQGCFLWTTSAILREFSEDRENVDSHTIDAIYQFFEAQSTNMLQMMSDLPPRDLPDVIEDFYRLLGDALLYYPQRLIQSSLFSPIFQAAVASLALEQRDPLNAALHYIRDVIAYGGDNPYSSSNTMVAPYSKETITSLIIANGEQLVKQVLAGMMINFPDDCFSDASGTLLGLFQILPQQTTDWVDKSIRMLSPETVSEAEVNRLISNIREKISLGPDEIRKVRSQLQDFTNSYRRRHIAPRDGLRFFEAERFHFDS
ncbi:putative exportin 1-like protein [Erysiphe necator]|uniref:Putative exportin 1-like protein n=1 Tax=Uncinula necator TaxID=52586 RepID=A0A0B1P8W7_UNCNE|nr:putative exportin 1-like protein [Erysiphe necator]